MAKKTGLGMGLDALFEDNTNESQSAQTVRMSEIEPNKNQPRRSFDDASLTELADSIRQHGLIQPILVRPMSNNSYQIVAGERRWRACRMLGMSEVPVVIKEFSDSETAQIAIIENVQREDLNPVEEAYAYRELMDTYVMTQEEVAKTVGKSRSSIANSVRLLNMPEAIKDMLVKGDLSAGQAKALASAGTEEEMLELAERAANGLITVRGIEKLVSSLKPKEESIKENTAEHKKSVNYMTEMEISLKNTLSRKVKINSKDGEKGSITIDFFDKDDLSKIAEKLTV